MRIPGLFFGYHVFGDENVGFLPSEGVMAVITNDFLNIESEMTYVKGFPFQIFLLSLPLRLFTNVNLIMFTVIGRLLSLFYAIATVILIYFLSKEIFNKKIGLIAALFLALSGLHVVYSYVSRPDTALVFWLYATIYFSLLFVKRDNLIWLILAIISSGFTSAMKPSFVNIIPLIYIFFLKKNKIRNILLIIFIFLGAFMLINGFNYGLNDFLDLNDVVLNENVNVREYNKLQNVLMQGINIIPGMGLAVFLFLIFGLSIRRKINKNIFFIIILPLLFFFIGICFLDFAPPRHILPVIPGLIIIAAYGFYKVTRKLDSRIYLFVLFLIISYQLVYVSSIEYNFIFTPIGKMGNWMLENIDHNAKIYIGDNKGNKYISDKIEKSTKRLSKNRAVNDRGLIVPFEFETTDLEKADYILLPNDIKYIRSSYNPLKKKPKCCNEVFGCNYKDCMFTQNLLEDKSNLIKEFKQENWSPELKIYAYFFNNYRSPTSDILLYKDNINK